MQTNTWANGEMLTTAMAEVANSKLLDIPAGILSKDACIVIAKTEWNAAVVDAMEKGCLNMLQREGVKDSRVFTVPGAFELPFGIRNYWDAHKYKDDRPLA